MQSANISVSLEGMRCKEVVAKILKILPLSFGLIQSTIARTVITTTRRPIADE